MFSFILIAAFLVMLTKAQYSCTWYSTGFSGYCVNNGGCKGSCELIQNSDYSGCDCMMYDLDVFVRNGIAVAKNETGCDAIAKDGFDGKCLVAPDILSNTSPKKN
jgi:hypothetical protein